MDPTIGNTRRIGFQDYYTTARRMTLRTIPTTAHVDKLNELATRDSGIANGLKTYDWNSHKVFATNDLSGLKLIANAGAMTFSARGWRTATVVNSKDVAQVMTTPFPSAQESLMAEDSWMASLLYTPGYIDWLHERVMHPKQVDSKYQLGGDGSSTAPDTPRHYQAAQYLTIMDDLIHEQFHTYRNPLEQRKIAKTLYQVMDSFRNLISSPEFVDQQLPEGQTIGAVAEKLALLLRDRDGNLDVAKEYVRYINSLPPKALFQALRLIATDKVNLQDHDGQSIPSSSLFHHSVFFDGDLVYASLLLEGNNDSGELTTYWVKRKVQEALKQIPKIDLSSVVTMEDAVEVIHRQTGSKVESKLRQIYFQKLVHDEILSQPAISQTSIELLLRRLCEIARGTQGITSLMIALLPEMAAIPDLNQSLAEVLLGTMEQQDKKKLIFPLECFQRSLAPVRLRALVTKNIDELRKRKEAIMSPQRAEGWCPASDRSALELFLDSHESTNSSPRHQQWDADLETPRPGKLRALGEVHSSGNNSLIKALYDHIAGLTISERWDELVQLIEELKDRETDGITSQPLDALSAGLSCIELGSSHGVSADVEEADWSSCSPPVGHRLIGARNACRLVGQLLQKQLDNHQISRETVQAVFDRLRTMHALSISDQALKVASHPRRKVGSHPRRKVGSHPRRFSSFIPRIVHTLFSPVTEPMEISVAESAVRPVEFFSLPDCIARQQHRNHALQDIRGVMKYDCSICFDAKEQTQLRNHNTAPAHMPPVNGHPGMPICDRCVSIVLATNPRCPACRASMKDTDFVPFLPNPQNDPPIEDMQ